MKNLKKICVIGNPCVGKTRFSRMLAKKLSLPLFHVDSIQFEPHLKLKNQDSTRLELRRIAETDNWLIDGLGPLSTVEDRFVKADLVVCIRLPIWQNYLFVISRLFGLLFAHRAELPKPHNELSFFHIRKLFQTIKNTELGLWPQLQRIFSGLEFAGKVVWLKDLSEIEKFLDGLNADKSLESFRS